jgi:hypothetical protein
MGPPIEECVNVAGAECVTCRLQGTGIGTREKAVVQALESDPLPTQSLLHPLVAVQADLDRVRHIRADLDEGGSPREVVHVEVIVVHGDRLSSEIERHAAPRSTPLVGLEGPRLLLRDANDHHAIAPRELRAIRRDDRVFVLAWVERNKRYRVVGGIGLHGRDKAIVHGPKQRRRGNRVAEMVPQEVAQPTRGLKLRHIALQVDAIKTPDRQRDVILDNAVDVGRHRDLLGRKSDEGTPSEHAGLRIGPNIKRPRRGRRLKVRRSRKEHYSVASPGYFDGARLLLFGLRRSFTACPW